jgi:hypothetical protein
LAARRSDYRELRPVLPALRLAPQAAEHLAASGRAVSAAWVRQRAVLMARVELRRLAAACGPEASLTLHSEQAALRSAIPEAPDQVAFAARLLRVVAEAAFVPDASPGESEVHLPRVESREAAAFAEDEPGAPPLVVATAAQVESDVQVQPAAPGAAEVLQPAEEAGAAAWGAQAVPLRAALAARHAEVVPGAVAQPDEVVQRLVAEPAALGVAVEAVRPAAARHGVAALRQAEVRPAVPEVVQAADPSVAASACRQGQPRPALARRPAARPVHEMRQLQTASRREQSSQAAQDEVWS